MLIYNSRNYQSLLALEFTTKFINYLQQQKLLELTSQKLTERPSFIIYNSRNYQSLLAKDTYHSYAIIYNSRNYQSLLATHHKTPPCTKSTIVEIIRAYQPGSKKRKAPAFNLQQQKLLELTSPSHIFLTHTLIYNSRNYQSLLAIGSASSVLQDLQQQKLLELTSRLSLFGSNKAIYNSRNYQSLLAELGKVFILVGSTIVEIIRAYQPDNMPIHSFQIYNSRNYQSLLALCVK